jgi:hypothetical protein
LKKIVADEGVAGLKVGWVPTLFGYGAQGMFKFGLNEFFKDVYSGILGEDALKSKFNKMAMWAAASGSAEIFADVALCPFEMTKVRMQVTLPGDANPLPKSMGAAMAEMNRDKANTKFPFGSLGPLWGRQGQFASHVGVLVLTSIAFGVRLAPASIVGHSFACYPLRFIVSLVSCCRLTALLHACSF